MRHRVAGKKLGRNGTHRRAVMRNIIASLFDHERIVTTIPKAKHYRRAAEKLITLGKVKTLHDEIGPRMKDRPGGYTRIVKLSKRRLGDNATQAVWELVDNKVLENKLAAEGAEEEG